MSMQPTNDFEKAAEENQGGSILSEFWSFLRYNKKWWLMPVVLVLLLFAVLIVMSGSAAAPFIYSIF